MFERMVSEHGYSIRKLADKLGKDKGYVENRLRLADAPDEVRELVSLRKDTLSHAYELMKVQDPKRRRRLADQVARGDLTLIKLRDKIEGRRARQPQLAEELDGAEAVVILEAVVIEDEPTPSPRRRPRCVGHSATTRWSTPRRRSQRHSTSWSACSVSLTRSARSATSTGTISRSI